jgi:tetratricopeptide (TPR) repeat protein
VLLMRLNKIVFATCLLLGSASASLGNALDEDIFKAKPKPGVDGSFAKTVDTIEATNKAAKARRLIEVANSKIAIEPNNDKYLAARAKCYEDLNELNLALADINRAIALNSQSQSYLLLRGSMNGRKHDYDFALKDFDRAMTIGPASADLDLRRAGALLMLNRYAESLKAAEHAVALDPNSPDGYVMRGFAKYHLHDYQGAKADDSKAESLGLKDDELHDLLSK